MNYIAQTKLYLTADKTRVVAAGSKDAGYVFKPAGGIVTQAEKMQYNIGSDLLKPLKEQPSPVAATPVATPSIADEPSTNEGEGMGQSKAVTVAPTTKAETQNPKSGSKGKKSK